MKSKTPVITFQDCGRNLKMVRIDGEVLGFIEKFPNTRTETHPWKAYKASFGAGRPPQVATGTMKPFYEGRSAAVNYLKQFRGCL